MNTTPAATLKTIIEPAHSAPTIHDNGTTAAALKTALANVYESIYAARELLRECAPNGRDYCFTIGSTLAQADAQHRYRGELLSAALDSIEAEMDRIDQQRDHRGLAEWLKVGNGRV